jgi:transaldolase
MKFFLDTGNVEEARKVAAWGLLDGVTTNPSLVAKEKRGFKEIVLEMCSITPGPVSAEVIAVEASAIIDQAHEIRTWAKNVVVKVPLIPEGIKALHVLSGEGIKCNVTLCFSPLQALLAAKNGAAYISPFVGRLDDVGTDGMQLVEEIHTIYQNYGYTTEIIVASARTSMHVLQAAMIGADITTMPFAVMEKLFNHPLTDKGLSSFLADWEKSGLKIG